MENRVSFTITATNRPDILNRTLHSFSVNLEDFDMKKSSYIINIDPLPNKDLIEENIKIADKYFGSGVYRVPDKPNFTAAVNWLWTTAETDFVFHLEDDWVLKQPTRLVKLIKSIEEKREIKQCIFRAYKYDYNKMALSPSVIKKELYKNIAGKLDESLNPEIQLRDPKILGMKLSGKNIRVHGKKPIVRDIGRAWIEGQQFKKPPKKAHFTSWEEK